MTHVPLCVALASSGSILAGGFGAGGHWTWMSIAAVVSVLNWSMALIVAYCEGVERGRLEARGG